VDRVACPWLIEKFVDKDAEFIYVPADQVMAEARQLAERVAANPPQAVRLRGSHQRIASADPLPGPDGADLQRVDRGDQARQGVEAVRRAGLRLDADRLRLLGEDDGPLVRRRPS